MDWIIEHGPSLLIAVGGFLGLLLVVGLGVLGMIWIGRGLRVSLR